jgi:dihydrofolate reductase
MVRPVRGKDLEQWAMVEFEEALGARALLLGRRSYGWFAARWSSRPGEWAARLNGLPKYIVSSTRWNNSTVLKGDVVTSLEALGGGERLFGETSDKKVIRLVGTRDRR